MISRKEARKGFKLGRDIFRRMIGKEYANIVLAKVDFHMSKPLPKYAEAFMPPSGWMGFACDKGTGRYAVYINREHHSAFDEVAFTIGHELAHVIQYIQGSEGTHSGNVFNTFKNVYCNELAFKKRSF